MHLSSAVNNIQKPKLHCGYTQFTEVVNSAMNVHMASAEDKNLVHKLKLPILLTGNKINTHSTFVGFHNTFVTCIQNAWLFFILG